MGVHVNRAAIHVADTFEYFRKAIYSSFDGYTSYSYIEEGTAWNVYSEIAPELIIIYQLDKGTDEETVFLAEKTAVDVFVPAKRVSFTIVNDPLADDVLNIYNALDGYHPDVTGQEHYHQHSEAIQTILGSLDGYDGGGGGVFGTNYLYTSRDNPYSTTSNNWKEVVSLDTGSLPAGDYHIGWSAELGCSNGNKIPYVQVEVDDTTVISEHTTRFAHNKGYSTHSGIIRIILGAGIHTVDIDINASDNGKYTTRIQRARIEMWRVI